MSDTYRLPEHIETERYLLRRIADEDAAPIFEAYATDAAVTRYLGWRPHGAVEETAAFVRRVAGEWESGAGFPLVVFARDAPDRLIGMFHPHSRGSTVNYGYVLRADAWERAAPARFSTGWWITPSPIPRFTVRKRSATARTGLRLG